MAKVDLMVRAPPSHVWRAIGTSWGDVHRILPSLASSQLLTEGPPGPGARRICRLATPVMGMETIEERVLAWDEGRSFTYVFDTPPWPMARITNTWTIESAGAGTRLSLSPELTLRGGRWTRWLAPGVLAAMSRSLRRELPEMVDAIERAAADATSLA